MPSAIEIDVIIPTLGHRAPALLRTIASIQSQQSENLITNIVVVVNGSRFNPGLVNTLDARPDILVVREQKAGVSHARYVGVKSGRSDYFTFIDDDDVLLPNALKKRLAAISGYDVVATNGYLIRNGIRKKIFHKFDQHPDDPMLALLNENWLASCGGLFRRQVGIVELFHGLPNAAEWTYLAFLMSMKAPELKINRCNIDTFEVYREGDNRASKSLDFKLKSIDVLRKMRRIVTRRELRTLLDKKIARGYVNIASAFYNQGKLKEARRHFFKSASLRPYVLCLPFAGKLLCRSLWPRKRHRK